MRTLSIIALLWLISSPAFLFAQTESKEEKPYIEVNGTAEKEVLPDEIYIAITLRERFDGKDKISIEKQEANLKSALKGIGISLDNLSLSGANADYVNIRRSKKDVLTRKDYTLKVGDATAVGKVFDQLDELKIMDAYVARVDHSKIEELKKEVRIAAIKAAKAKAEYLLAAIDKQLGQPLVINEINPVYRMDKSMLNMRTTEMFGDGMTVKPDDPIQYEKIKLEGSIYVKFEIK